MTVEKLRQIVTDYYLANPRDLPWRHSDVDGSFDAYKILVSELMLQQTQVGRVIPKYTDFLLQFPTVRSLAEAPLSDVLRVWQGLGYNRRAKFLHQAAQQIVTEFKGVLPDTVDGLVLLPGVGANTAGAIVAYAFDRPATFVETNIRSVFLHHLFPGQHDVSDTRLLPYVQKAARDTTGGLTPRQWYWALMDYGTYLKSAQLDTTKRSKHYKKQSAFQGSRRQIRGSVLRLLSDSPHTFDQLENQIRDEARLASVIDDLIREQLIYQDASVYLLGSGILT